MYQSTEDLYANYSNSAHTLRSKASQTSSKMITFATEQLEKSVLFSDLNQKKVTKEALHYIFGQFKFMRDNVHLLFSQNLCLIENAGHPLMNHILFVLSKHQVDENQITEPHALMFHKFLLDLGMTEDAAQNLTVEQATKDYNGTYEFHRKLIVSKAKNRQEAAIRYFCYVIGREVSAAVRHSKLTGYLDYLYPNKKFEFIQNHEIIEQEHADEESDLMLSACAHVDLDVDIGLDCAYLATRTHFQWLDHVYAEYKEALHRLDES